MTRRYVSDWYEPGEDDRGARDEGYYYEWCNVCYMETEHESEVCLSCGEDMLISPSPTGPIDWDEKQSEIEVSSTLPGQQ